MQRSIHIYAKICGIYMCICIHYSSGCICKIKWKQPKCPTGNNFFKLWYNHTMKYYVAIKILEYMYYVDYMKMPCLSCLYL